MDATSAAAAHVRSRDERNWLFRAAGGLLCVLRYTLAACLGAALGAAVLLVVYAVRSNDALADVDALGEHVLSALDVTGGTLGGAACGIALLCLFGLLQTLPWRRLAAHAAYATVVLVYRCHALFTCTLRCGRLYEPEAGRVLLSVQTNGMGHVVQAMRLIELLKARGVLVDTVCFGELSKVPPSYLAALRRLLPEALLFDLGHEVDHDELGYGSNLLATLAASCCLVAAPQGLRVFRRIAALCVERRFALCLSLWEYHVPLFLAASGAPMALVQVATQGMLYLEDQWPLRKDHFQAQLMYLINLGGRGVLFPLLFARPREPPAHGAPGAATPCAALPIIVRVPPLPPAPPPDGYFVDALLAYSATPACLAVLARVTRRRVLLHTKNVEKWRFHFRKQRNIETRPISDSFAALLPRCAGLVASPSPGVVLQALAAGTACYVLPAAPGHLEQSFNHAHLFKSYAGLASPATTPIEAWAEATRPGDPALRAQALELRAWLDDFERAADAELLPCVRRLMRPADAAGGAPAAPAPAGDAAAATALV